LNKVATLVLCAVIVAAQFLSSLAQAATIWIEGEKPSVNKMNRHPWWYDKVKRDQLSGGDFISNFNKDNPGEAEYRFSAPQTG